MLDRDSSGIHFFMKLLRFFIRAWENSSKDQAKINSRKIDIINYIFYLSTPYRTRRNLIKYVFGCFKTKIFGFGVSEKLKLMRFNCGAETSNARRRPFYDMFKPTSMYVFCLGRIFEAVIPALWRNSSFF